MSTLVFLLEEQSAKNMLQGILPRLIPDGTQVQYMTFSGKKDLERQMVKKIRYWRDPDSRFIVLRDRDSANCLDVKSRLLSLTRESGKGDACLVRIACDELESFFLGDLEAVAQALNIPALKQKQGQKKYRTPDAVTDAAEELKRLTSNKYAKLAGSLTIGPHLKLDGSNRSQSFGVLLDAIRRQVALMPGQPGNRQA